MSAAIEPGSDPETRDAWVLFDGDATTGLRSHRGGRIRVRLELASLQRVDELAVHGATQGALNVYVSREQGLAPVPGLIALTTRTEPRWQRFKAAEPIFASSLVLEWIPSAEQGPNEIVFWGLGAPVRAFSERELSDRVLAGRVAGALELGSPRKSAEVARISGGVSFPVAIAPDPRAFARAFLVYELRGLGHWSSVSRSINGAAARLPARSEPGAGGLQVEEISPRWLKRGANDVSFLPVDARHTPGYEISNVRVVAVPHASLTEPFALRHTAEGHPSLQPGDRLQVAFDRATQPQVLALELASPSRSALVIEQTASPRRSMRIDLGGLAAGWHRFDLDNALSAPSRLDISVSGGAKGNAALRQLLVAGSPELQSAPDRLVISYPLHGECSQGTAEILGFIASSDAGRSSLQVDAAGRQERISVAADGSFRVSLKATSERPFSVQLRSRTPAGSELARTVPISPCAPAPTAAADAGLQVDTGAPFGSLVEPEKATVLSYGGARLEIPAGALKKPTRITIRPLVGGQVRPMGKAMRNVTPEARAFRFGPHGLKFEKPIKLSLPYDSAQLPAGLSARDVHGFYFDEVRGEWLKVGRYDDGKGGTLTSLTDHFTDFVNATLAMPDAPGTKSFNPNEMKGIELGSPSAGVSLIEAPEANALGSARLGYPLETPPGRNGIEPNLQLSYDSERKNGWLGVGWDVELSSIQIDTRFGVPKYDGSEIYLVDGQALTQQGSTFKRRVEGSFDRIERLGSGANDYHWVITDKNGTRSTYGASANARLGKPGGGPIFQWYLEKVRDAFGNTLSVTYEHDGGQLPGPVGSPGVPWVQVYPKRIDYTSHASGLPAHYHVDFALDAGARSDTLMSARSGFVTLTRHLLERVDVSFGNELIRSYRFAYQDGAFKKKRLAHVALHGLGLHGARELYRHAFSYFDMPGQGTSLDGFSEPVEWAALPGQREHGLSANEDIEGGFSAYVGVSGPSCFPHAGLGGGASLGGDQKKAAFTDMNGDGLPDFVDGRAVLLNRPNANHQGGAFQSSLTLPGDIGNSRSIGAFINAAAHLPAEIGGAGVDWSWNWATEERRLEDINGDGFTDLTGLGGTTLFNGTSYAAGEDPAIDLQPVGNFDDEDANRELASRYYATSTLVRWVAPLSGTVRLTGGVSLEATTGDGVTASIIKTVTTTPAGGGQPTPQNTNVWSKAIAPGAQACTPQGTDECGSGLNVEVAEGDRLYFRVDPGDDIQGDATAWNPTLTYTRVCEESDCENVTQEDLARKDGFGLPALVYTLSADFRLTDPLVAGWVAGVDGEVDVQASLSVTQETNDFPVRLLQREEVSGAVREVARATISGDVGSTSLVWHTRVFQGDTLYLAGEFSARGVDPARVTWHPTVSFTQVCGVETDSRSSCRGVTCTSENGASVCRLEALPDDPQEIKLPPALVSTPAQVSDTTYNGDEPDALPTFTVPRTGTVSLQGSVLKRKSRKPVTVIAARAGARLLEKTYGTGDVYASPQPLPAAGEPAITFEVAQNEALTFTRYFEDIWDYVGSPGRADGPALLWRPELVYADNGERVLVQPVNALLAPPIRTDNRLAGGFRGWAYGEWTTQYAFDETKFEAKPDDGKPVYLTRPEPHWEGIRRDIPAPWEVPGPVWSGSGADFYITATRMKPSRIGGRKATELGGAPGLAKSVTKTTSLQTSFAGFSGQSADGDTKVQMELLDLNGDQRPDSTTYNHAQFQNCGAKRCDGSAEGSFAGSAGSLGMQFGALRRIDNHNMRFGLGFGSAASALAQKVKASGATQAVLSVLPSLGRSYGRSQTEVDLVDINGDGLPDHVRNLGGSSEFQVQLNLGYGFSPPIRWTGASWNGPDIDPLQSASSLARAASTALSAPLQSSRVRVEDNVTNSLQIGYAGIGGGVAHSVSRTLVDFVDVNADGLPDRVLKLPGENALRVRLNLGDRFDTEEITWRAPGWGVSLEKKYTKDINGSNDALSFSETTSTNVGVGVPILIPLVVACLSIELSATAGFGKGATELGFNDMDGDGAVDHVLKVTNESSRNPSGSVRVRLNQTGKSNLLRRVVRPLGGEFELDYHREGNKVAHDVSPKVDMPSNQWVLSRVVLRDGRENGYTRTFDYHGSGFFDRAERENYGFSHVSTVREDNSRFEQYFHNQDYYRRGLLTHSLEKDAAGNLFVVQQLEYRTPPTPPTLPTLTGSFFPAEEERTTAWYEGTTTDVNQPGKSTRESRQWDNDGNLIEMLDRADASTADDLRYTIRYHRDSAAHITKANYIEARDAGGTLLRKRTSIYEPGTGRLQSLTNVINGGQNPDTSGAYLETNATWTFAHDGFGNLTGATDPKASQFTYGYDPLTQTYRTRVIDSFGYTSTSVPNYHFGSIAEVTDVNGHKVRYDFDEFGRLSRVFGATDQGSATPTLGFTYSLPEVAALPAWARTAHKDITRSDDPEILTVAFVDGLDRVIQTKKELERDLGGGPEPGMSVSGKLVYDARGRVSDQGQPVFDTGPATQFVTVPLKHPTHTAYDVLSRIVRVDTPDDRAPGGIATTESVYEFGTFEGQTTFQTTVTDARGNQRITHRDVDDSTIAVEEFNDIAGQEVRLRTRYTYNAADELERVTDARGHVTRAEYDTLGRMVALISPDAGRTEWSYDLAGNLGAKQTDRLRAVGQRVRYHYTHNRLDAIDYPDSEDVLYVYGTPEQAGDAFGNVAGRVIEERSEAGTKTLKYDRYGNVIEHSMSFVRIREDSKDPYSATMTFEFDAFGRMLKMRFPNEGREEVSYKYDRGGLVTTVFGINTEAVHPPKGPPLTNYLLHVGYDEFEQRTRLVNGNGVESRYAYDEKTRRLTQINSDHQRRPPANGPPKPFQRLRYEHDLVGNIVQMRNEAPFDDRMQGVFVATTSQSFSYDKLYQLTAADGLYQDESKSRQRYSLSFDYDEIGNITLKNQQSFLDKKQGNNWVIDQPNSDQTYRSVYTYDSGRPHAPSRVDEHLDNGQVYARELNYDASGNQTGWLYHHSERREIDWNEEDRIREIRHQGHKLSRNLYDGDGERGVVVDYYGNEETAYLGQNYTIRNASYPTKHIFLGDQLLASKLDPSWFPHPPTLYYHHDHLGSAQFATNDQQELTQHDEFFPTGELWQDQTEPNYTVRRTYRFTGKELDVGAKLFYFGARWYDARLSQWVNPDPILADYMRGRPNLGVFMSKNLGLYSYAGNNPVMLIDPDGRFLDAAKAARLAAEAARVVAPAAPVALAEPTFIGEVALGVALIGVATYLYATSSGAPPKPPAPSPSPAPAVAPAPVPAPPAVAPQAGGGGKQPPRPPPPVTTAEPDPPKRGGAHPNTRAAASRGSSLHADKPGHLPDQLRARYPDTKFEFTKPGQPGRDVRVVGGKHPSEYPGSSWKPGVSHGDFKPGTPSVCSHVCARSIDEVAAAHRNAPLQSQDGKARMSEPYNTFAGVRLKVAPGWCDITQDLPEDSPPTLAGPESIGVLQISTAKYEAGRVPNIRTSDLREMLNEFAAAHALGAPSNVHERFEGIVSGDFRNEEEWLRVWYVSNGRDVVFVTYTSQQPSDVRTAEELAEAERMVDSIKF
ncbi:MAG TPA: SpvB/TcaC N-terminal domain-containing protein [Polyangiaceae bacterium]